MPMLTRLHISQQTTTAKTVGTVYQDSARR
jgi:hypothetical protein